MIPMHKNKTASIHQFAMVPKAEIPRSSFMREFTHKTTFDENYLVPVYIDEVLPGDTFSLRMTAFARFATPIYPIMDNMYLDSFFFFVPCRLIWSHWQNFMGEQPNTPTDSISYTIPTISAGAGYNANSIYDYMGIPCTGQVLGGGGLTHSALPLRAYNLIWNQWFRDENLQNAVGFGATNTYNDFGDGPDLATNYTLLKRGKRHDYITASLPWTQKGGAVVAIPGAGQATVKAAATAILSGAQNPAQWLTQSGGTPTSNTTLVVGSGGPPNNNIGASSTAATAIVAGQQLYPSNLYADLTTATIATVNALRLSFQTQKLLERDARGGTRYTEIVRAHFGVISPDARLQRPEYLGGGTTPVQISPIPQTSATNLTGGTSPLGTLSAYGQIVSHGHGFTQSFTEHGYIIGMVNIRADLTYQQGMRRLWSRSTRYDFYWPEFAMLGEQAVLMQELYALGSAGGANDATVWGYQERWAEYRYLPNMITGQFRSTYATPLDTWHLSEKFTSAPTLGATFIQQNTPISRVVAVNTPGSHFIFDSLFQCRTTRPMPLYSVPGLIDHF